MPSSTPAAGLARLVSTLVCRTSPVSSSKKHHVGKRASNINAQSLNCHSFMPPATAAFYWMRRWRSCDTDNSTVAKHSLYRSSAATLYLGWAPGPKACQLGIDTMGTNHAQGLRTGSGGPAGLETREESAQPIHLKDLTTLPREEAIRPAG